MVGFNKASDTKGPPRLTSYLRFHSSLCQPSLSKDDFDLQKVLTNKREDKRKSMLDHGASWPNTKCSIELLGEKTKVNLKCYLRDIENIAMQIAPEADTRAEVCLLLLKTCVPHEVLPVAARTAIKRVTGEVKNSLIDKAHKATQNIVQLIGLEEVEESLQQLASPFKKISFGNGIKVGAWDERPDYSIYGLLDLRTNCETETNETDSWSVDFERFRPPKANGNSNGEAKDTQAIDGAKSKELSRSLAQDLLSKNFGDASVAKEVASTAMALLAGPKSNAQLENELLELLGFDSFELIGSLLSDRDTIVSEHINKTVQSKLNKIQASMTPSERELLRKNKKEKKAKGESEFDPVQMKIKRELSLANAQHTTLLRSAAETTRPTLLKFPFVFDSFQKAKQTPAFVAGKKINLPEGAVRKVDTISEQVDIPPLSRQALGRAAETKLIDVGQLDDIGRAVLSSCSELNRLQSVVFPAAYHSSENLLICAPTGAGKTNVAALAVAHQIRQHSSDGVIASDKFKIVYVAPMKALATEMTRTFARRLQPLGLSVKELTGDTSWTKAEIMATTMIITTPEKWDVTTRKPGDTQLSQLVKLLIIDEVHLLHGDRGPVLETIVARTLRMVESQQSMIRIVGLSATLPNYIDVASFLRVNPYKGLFFFDGRFRPVPLALSFFGVKAISRSQQMEQMNRVTFEKAVSFVIKGQQVMVFVHSRSGTLKTAQTLIRMAEGAGKIEFFAPKNGEHAGRKISIKKAKSRVLEDLFMKGFGVHHAGLLKHDRNLMEQAFTDGYIKVLVTTATLAWGVNLPAHAVIIKGTDVYNSKQGGMVDLGILDVLQIFGRAGRPQFDKSGHGSIVTTYEKLSHYLSLLTNQYPIESSFVNLLADNLNAEVALGNVTTVNEAAEWLSYTYLYVRMRKNPLVYGVEHSDLADDPSLSQFRVALIKVAASALDRAHMIRFDKRTGYLHSTDLGRIASQFYIKFDTVEVFNEKLCTVMTEADILMVISHASEFTHLKIRDEELDELDQLRPRCELPTTVVEEAPGKVNVLMQSYLSRLPIEAFSLIADMNYICDNSVRIARALFEVVLHRGWPLLSGRFLEMAKMLERRLWHFETPLRQMEYLKPEVLTKVERARLTIHAIRDMHHSEISGILHSSGHDVLAAAWQIPLLVLEATCQPITSSILRVTLDIKADFNWVDRLHGTQETYWVWVEDPISNHMYHHEHFAITKKQVIRGEEQQLVFAIPVPSPRPSQYYVRATSDVWLGCDAVATIALHSIRMPKQHPPHTDLLDLTPLPVSAFGDLSLSSLFRYSHFNPIQTQIFHCLFHTNTNALIGAPTGSGKTVAAEMAMFRVFKKQPDKKVVYIAPMKALVRERVIDWTKRLGTIGKKVVELTGDVTPDTYAIKRADVIVTTPEKWDGVSRSWKTRSYVSEVVLIVIDEIHLLGEDRGPVLEVIVSRTNFIGAETGAAPRIVGLSTALANARDLASWLGIGEMGMYNFRPCVRPVPLEVHISGFPGKHYCPRMATMNKPTFQAIRTHSPDQPVLVFVSSRRQTRLTALDLIGFIVTDDNPKQWLHMPDHEMEQILSGIKDENLRLCMSFGIGLHHAGLVEADKTTVEELFVNLKIQILIATATLAWGVNFPAHLVVVKGTEYFDAKTKRYVDFPITDVLQMMGRAGRPQFDTQGVAVILVHDQKKYFYKKFLYEPFPVESSLVGVLPDHLNAEIVAGTIATKQDAINYLTWTYFFRRLAQNPSYYHLSVEVEENANANQRQMAEAKAVSRFLSTVVDEAIGHLSESYCICIGEDNRTLYSNPLGRISSFYYLSHFTARHFADTLSPDATFADLLDTLTTAHEFSELPVRHNEELINADLAKICPLPVNSATLDCPSTKAFLLLQAHMSRLHLPVVDYLTDTKGVVDNTLRVIQAMIDVCAGLGWLRACLQAQILLQMISQARWHTDSPLLCLPHVDNNNLYCFKQKGKNGRLLHLPELMWMCREGNADRTLFPLLAKELQTHQVREIHDVLNCLPILNLTLSMEGRFPKDISQIDEFEEAVKIIDVEAQGKGRFEYLRVFSGEQYALVVSLADAAKRVQRRAWTPRLSKPSGGGWILSVGLEEELLALRRTPRAPGRGAQPRAVTVAFKAPQKIGQSQLSLYVMSESYLGLDQQLKVLLEVVGPSPHSPEEAEADDTEPVNVSTESEEVNQDIEFPLLESASGLDKPEKEQKDQKDGKKKNRRSYQKAVQKNTCKKTDNR